MVDILLCGIFLGILLLSFLLFYLFLDTYVNQKTASHNEQVKIKLNQIILSRLNNINKNTQQCEPESIRYRTSLLNQFLAEVKKYD